MSPRLVLVTLASPLPMGQQVYEREISARAPDALGDGWSVDRIEVRSLRSTLGGTVRVPARLLADAPATLRRAVGAALYGRHDVVHRMDLRLPPARRPEVLTVHDVIPWRFADEGRPVADAALSARRAAAVLCPSQFAADEVASVLGVRDPVVAPNGVAQRFFDASPLGDAELAELGIRRPFVLHAGGCTDRKNLAGLADAWSLLEPALPDVQLVLMGPADPRRDRLFAGHHRTVRTGRLDDAAALGVLSAASTLVVPSTYEGFGLPVLEGMAAGVPVVAARRSSLPEVCGEAAYLVEPDGPGLAAGIQAAVAGGTETDDLVARGRIRASRYTWEASAAVHAEWWRKVGP